MQGSRRTRATIWGAWVTVGALVGLPLAFLLGLGVPFLGALGLLAFLALGSWWSARFGSGQAAAAARAREDEDAGTKRL